jgi:ferredoxin-NADP reductase
MPQADLAPPEPGPSARGRLAWQVATVVDRIEETERAVSLVLDVPDWAGHLPGQHVDIRLTAEDGYQAQRSYSIAAPASDGLITLTVERIPDGEVSPYLTDELRVGDGLELRGPIGGYFVWRADAARPLLLVAGGSGLVPLMAIVRARVGEGSSVPVRLLLSARSSEELLYRAELEAIEAGQSGVSVVRTLTRSQPEGWTGHRRRVDRDMLAEVAYAPDARARTFICGPTGFVEAVASGLVALGQAPADILTERFGPSGG